MGDPDRAVPAWIDLPSDEHVVLRTSPTPNLVLASFVGGVVLMLSMAVIVGFLTSLTTGRRVSFTVLLLIVGLIGGTFVATKRWEYVMTNRRVYSGVGLRTKRVDDSPLEAVDDVTLEQSGWQQMLDVGTVRFVSEDDSDCCMSFRLVENPADLQRHVLQFVDLSSRH